MSRWKQLGFALVALAVSASFANAEDLAEAAVESGPTPLDYIWILVAS